MDNLKINFRPRSNPRKDLGWEDESGCDRCGKVSSAYIEITLPLNYQMIDGRVETELSFILCKSCLNEAEKMLNEVYLNPARSLGDKAPNF